MAAGSLTSGMGTSFMANVGRAAVNGAVGGVMSVAQGGSFKAGFASASVSSLGGSFGFESPAAQVAAGAAVGGLASMAAGGKFGDGALTGAYSAYGRIAADRMASRSTTSFDSPAAAAAAIGEGGLAFANRPLQGSFGVMIEDQGLGYWDKWNIEVLHQEAFSVQDGILVSKGYSSAGVHQDTHGISDYTFTEIRSGVSVDLTKFSACVFRPS